MIAKIRNLWLILSRSNYIKKIVLILTILSLITTLAFAIYSYYLTKTLFINYEETLEYKLDEQVARIIAFLDENEQNASELAAEPLVLDYLKKTYFKENISAHTKDELYNYLITRKEDINFKSVSLISNNSTVVFSTNPLLRNVHLEDAEHSTTPLFRAFFASSMTLINDFSEVAYSTILKEPAFYLTIPVIIDGIVVGILAFQIDEQKLNNIAKDYLDLGTTGETVIGVLEYPIITFITASRNNPSLRFTSQKLFKNIEHAPENINETALKDYDGNKILSTLSFISRVDWVTIVKFNLQEVLTPLVSNNKYLIVFAILTLILALLGVYFYDTKILKKLSVIFAKLFRWMPYTFRNPEFFFLCIFLTLSIFSIYQYKHAQYLAIKKSQDLAKAQVETGIKDITTQIKKIRRVAEFIAEDLHTEGLIYEDIRKRLRRDIVETEAIVEISIAYSPYKFSNSLRLYAPSIAQEEDGTLVERDLAQIYDYTNKKEGVLKTNWYTKTMESQKPQWLGPIIYPASKTKVITYAIPFYFKDEKEPAGVVGIDFKTSLLTEIAQNIGIGETGYSFILANDQTFIAHSAFEDISPKKTLLEFAQEQGNEDLERIAEQIKKGKPILEQISSESTIPSWIYTFPIRETGWTIAMVFPANEVGLAPSAIIADIFDIIIYLSITFLLAVAIICHYHTKRPLFNFLNFANIILIITILCLWYVIQKTSGLESKTDILITDQASVNKFINFQKREAQRKNEPPPIVIPCGIELYSLQRSSPKEVSFSGYIWHRYHKYLHKDLQRVIRIPQASSFNIINTTTVTEGDWEIVGLNITATIYHELDYSHYPFEKHHIVIPLEHAEIGKHILLVPDLVSYNSLNPYKLPGIDITFSKTAFNIIKTFFDYRHYEPNSDLGVREYWEISDLHRLGYNAIISIELLVPFIFFFLPLLVILISIFAILVLEQPGTSSYTMVGPFTGLLFSLVLLHRALREAAPSSGVVYLEYAFIYTYIILILLVIHTLLSQRYIKSDFYQIYLVRLFKIIFWPLQITAWIITTIIVFY